MDHHDAQILSDKEKNQILMEAVGRAECSDVVVEACSAEKSRAGWRRSWCPECCFVQQVPEWLQFATKCMNCDTLYKVTTPPSGKYMPQEEIAAQRFLKRRLRGHLAIGKKSSSSLGEKLTRPAQVKPFMKASDSGDIHKVKAVETIDLRWAFF